MYFFSNVFQQTLTNWTGANKGVDIRLVKAGSHATRLIHTVVQRRLAALALPARCALTAKTARTRRAHAAVLTRTGLTVIDRRLTAKQTHEFK